MFTRIFSSTYYLPLHARNWFSPMVSPKRLHEAAFMYVGLGVAAGGFRTAGSATTDCFCIHPLAIYTRSEMWSGNGESDRQTSLNEWMAQPEWGLTSDWVLWEKTWLRRTPQVNAGACVMLHVLKEHSIQPPAAQAFTMFLTRTCLQFPVCNIKTTCCCEVVVGFFCFLFLSFCYWSASF